MSTDSSGQGPRAHRLRWGHAPGHLRDAFRIYLEDDEDLVLEDFWWSAGMQARWDHYGPQERRRWLFGRLWNCTNVMPGELREEVGSRLVLDRAKEPVTYAAAVQALARSQA